MSLAVDLFLAGFDRLHSLGHVVGRCDARELAEVLFRLRGLGHIWTLYQSAPQRSRAVRAAEASGARPGK